MLLQESVQRIKVLEFASLYHHLVLSIPFASGPSENRLFLVLDSTFLPFCLPPL
jgi:hypothetical protein